MPLTVTGMDLEIIIQNEVNSKEKEECHPILLTVKFKI